MGVKRVYVEKKPEFAVQAKELRHEVKSYLGIKTVKNVRVLIRYDVENLSDATFERACNGVFAEPPVDDLYLEKFEAADDSLIFSVEYLPGQFDQRADSAVQCVQFIKEDELPVIKTATTYVIEGEISEEEMEAIKAHCINPVDSRETGLEKPETLVTKFEEPADVKIFDGFKDMPEAELKELYSSLGLAMTFKDFQHIQNYFKGEEHRDPSMTEIRVLDTYWSDHCRHTTFSTELTEVSFGDGDYRKPMEDTYKEYLQTHSEIFKGREDKFVCLMDLALMAMRKLKKEGKLQDQEESDEINACSIVVPVDVDGKEEEWLINFKNETHNHPTEIEPFGGAATCLGGAIRDPLSGRAYVYQSMRITGAGDPRQKLEDTLPGKLPQRKICEEAAHGFSSYGNQIGLTTGFVHEVYDQGYVAKRMELGAVVAAAPEEQVKRLIPENGQIVLLIGGRTGRDGIGGATGSSKKHELKTTETAGAEVQKGNPVEERKIQRLFRNKEFSKKIVRCNDFGAGGVSVAVGELAPGLDINLDAVLKKYEGLNGTELAISESQERMAIVINECDKDFCIQAAHDENLEVVQVATVTDKNRLTMKYMGDTIVDISRDFLDEAGAKRYQDIHVELPDFDKAPFNPEAKENFTETTKEVLSRLSTASQKGLVERFDSSIGNGTVLSPFGGKTYRTETEGMAALIPVLGKETTTCSLMSYGYSPLISEWSPYHGAINAVVESVAKIIAMGGTWHTIRFSFQEFFEKLLNDPKRWGKPFAALLGAYNAQKGFGIPSIGGKDSMSGSFEDIDVPPTLVSFAVDYTKASHVVTPEFKKAGNNLLRVDIPFDEYGIPDYKEAGKIYDTIHKLMRKDVIASAYALGAGGLIEAISKMSFGNMYGVKLVRDFNKEDLTKKYYGSILVEIPTEWMDEMAVLPNIFVGRVTDDSFFQVGEEEISLKEMCDVWQKPLESVFPTKTNATKHNVSQPLYRTNDIYVCKNKVAVPKVFIPVFPGTNCEYDSAKAFRRAGAEVETLVFKNQSESDILESVDAFEKAISQAQIIMFPGGFSAGDEPEGSAKFFATVFRNEKIKESVMKLLNERDGLALGICNGFQALVKLGLVPYGEIVNQTEDSPTLTMNEIGRHVSTMVYTKVVTNKSPWLRKAVLDQIYAIPASHGEGRFVASKEWIEKLFKNGQVATQYVNLNGEPTMDDRYNPNGSYYAIEGITSPDGRVLGKMAHSERIGENIAKNIYAKQDQKIFESGVEYFK